MGGKAAGRFWSKRVDPMLDRISAARVHRRLVDERLNEMVEQFRPNSGTSLVDRVERLENGQDELGRQVAETRATSVENRGLLHQVLGILTDPER